MTDNSNHEVPKGLADLPRDVRERLEVERQQEIRAGLDRAHVATARLNAGSLAAGLARLAEALKSKA